MKTNQQKLQALTDQLLNDAIPNLREKFVRAIRSGALDVTGWDENHNQMILPKTILIAALLSEACEYGANGTKWEKEVKKGIRRLGECM